MLPTVHAATRRKITIGDNGRSGFLLLLQWNEMCSEQVVSDETVYSVEDTVSQSELDGNTEDIAHYATAAT